ncbi:1-acyl-sn-glycerol-3-phosphate acyltransferase [Catenulispora sp. NF23]|uniref:1-acyl-sn-glycerol-3-phosphate acyltransferase n=1 Tax=Catenulispora pinistramenti TaxID=2705254 RepID=A0ABS5L188_9ACTN|nr:1-acyl-sn-glycerol-3-phosphate acyltransferase [Catenulispora pinistramenti]MBS2536168.1 1-acyl-sn-glycerol-3-phosphate acyltransferase [Catenulispora pinistramenti]MBS2552088.1 1-acyl-sn-glycerol-3-phosphate acyltransferase [Catenulispora pinistramenti]
MNALTAARAVGRRLLGICLLVAASVVILIGTAGAAVFTIVSAPWRPRLGRARRVLGAAAVYAAVENVGLLLAAWRWLRLCVGRDAARDRRDSIRALRRSLAALRKAARRFGGLDVEFVAGPTAEQETDPPDSPNPPDLPAGPLIVCGRHGGVGGAFLLADLLLSGYDRVPRVVLKQTLAWDPLIDALLGRLPHAFIDPQPGDSGATAARIGELAQDMADGDALLIFPEGGNFTPHRRRRAITRLRHRGLVRQAARADRLRNVMPPHPDGLFAALEAAPEADVVFVAHTGLDHLQSVADVWRAIPLAGPVAFTWWVVPAAEVPEQEQSRLSWLEDNWARIDRWVADSRTPR